MPTPFENMPENFDKQDAIEMMLDSIAQTEFGLANIITAEAEKIETAIKRHEGNNADSRIEASDLLQVNKSVERMLRKIIVKEMLLGFQLEDVIELSQSAQAAQAMLAQANSQPAESRF